MRDAQRFLADILDLLQADKRKWFLIIDVANSQNRFVQVLAPANGPLYAECVSNEFLQGDDQLGAQETELLPVLGWEWPAPPHKPNWSFHDEPLNAGSALSELLLRTIQQVFGCTDDDVLALKVFQRKVQLRSERNGPVSRFLEAYLDVQGNLHIDGQHLGPVGMEDQDEDESFKTISAEDVPKVMTLLGGQAGDNVLDLLEERYSGAASYELEKKLRGSGIKIEPLAVERSAVREWRPVQVEESSWDRKLGHP